MDIENLEKSQYGLSKENLQLLAERYKDSKGGFVYAEVPEAEGSAVVNMVFTGSTFSIAKLIYFLAKHFAADCDQPFSELLAIFAMWYAEEAEKANTEKLC